MGSDFHESPLDFLELLQKGFILCQQLVLESDLEGQAGLHTLAAMVKKNLDVRLCNVPPCKEIMADSIRELNSTHFNKFISVFSTVTRTGQV